jgi:hypothetical protein
MSATSEAAATYFDISTGITAERFYTHTDTSSSSLNLFGLHTYNDGAVPVWTKVYDMSAGFISNDHSANAIRYHNRIRLNVATPAGAYRDLKFPKGMTFNNGLWFRTTTEPNYDSSLGPGTSVLFVNGSYYRPGPVVIRGGISESDHIATIPAFGAFDAFDAFDAHDSVPEASGVPEAFGGLTGLDDLDAEADAEAEAVTDTNTDVTSTDTDIKTIDFTASTHISGSVTFTYDKLEQLLSLTTLINYGDVKAMTFSDGEQEYVIDMSDYSLRSPLTTDNINVTFEQLQTSRLDITLVDGTTVSVARNI